MASHHTTPPFLGIDPEKRPENPRIEVIPVPFEATTSYAQGTANAPLAILEASAQVEFYDEELDFEPARVGITTRDMLDFKNRTVEQSMQLIENAVAATVKANRFPLVLGGEHSITPPAVRGVATKYPKLTVVQLDAHADLRQEYEGTPYSHACAMARVREDFPAVQIGIRSLSKEEALWVKRDKLPVYFAYELHDHKTWMRRTLDDITTDDVYLTVDVDVFDSSIMSETGTPEPGGLTWWDVTTFVRLLMEKKNVVGMDFVELLPTPGRHASDFLVARLISKCIGYWQLRSGSPESPIVGK
ncbi:MAG: agmatinase [Deltaproteobacteria bacterium RIFCSPLOWO2_02_FULL_44_10]|nr:MAG: agmatinase [Deltaproteobacteria bacterium RIFCSPHIGHO2_02_FULL_44_16]OGQ46591.1 MAG: agmatinase [Deltaproteobacteria bacterium RIFCSPLOWO2_02_FULL_44_10]